jgi:uncharacterized RDD family membrane protein YckC
MQILIAKDGKQTGPFSQEELRSMMDGGSLTRSDLCWHEGLPTWVPISQILGFPTQGPPPVTLPSQSVSLSSGQHPGFLIRLAAHLIDTVVLYVLSFLFGAVLGVVFGALGANADVLVALGAIAGILVAWLYYALMESSSKQATLGKMACGLIVTNLQGQRISFAQATGRYFGMIVSALILGIGFIMCAWTERKQCLHDIMSGCLMFKRPR